MGIPDQITFADYLQVQHVAFEWAESYDHKDWARLRTILGPAIRIDLRSLKGPLYENLTPDQFSEMAADRKVMGDPCVKTQHLLGGNSWRSLGDGTIQVQWQTRVAHQRFAAEDMTEVVKKWHSHGTNEHVYKKIDGVWKIVVINTKVDWTESNLSGSLNADHVK